MGTYGLDNFVQMGINLDVFKNEVNFHVTSLLKYIVKLYLAHLQYCVVTSIMFLKNFIISEEHPLPVGTITPHWSFPQHLFTL